VANLMIWATAHQAPIWLVTASFPGDNDPLDQNRLKT
jgi:hypothetical protein